MSKTPQEEPFSESHLGSPEYRERLMQKLNCLIAVLQVATAKVRKNMAGSPPDAERLARICANLQSTLEVCQRARTALERRQRTPSTGAERSQPMQAALPPASPRNLELSPKPGPKFKRPKAKRGKGARRELSDISTEAERRKFEKLPPIDRRTILHCDLDELARRLCS